MVGQICKLLPAHPGPFLLVLSTALTSSLFTLLKGSGCIDGLNFPGLCFQSLLGLPLNALRVATVNILLLQNVVLLGKGVQN